MSLQDYYTEYSRCYWASSKVSECGCKGHGWALSDVDTWHECPIHKGLTHPESVSEESEPDEAQFEAACLLVMERDFERENDHEVKS